MEKKRKQLQRMIFILLALILCVQPLCAYAESDDGAEACEISDDIEEKLPEPEEEIVEEEAEEEFPADEEIAEESEALPFESSFADGEDAYTETDENSEGEEEIVEETLACEPETFSDPEAAVDNDALFQAYFENLLMPKPKLRRAVGPSNLTGWDLQVYNFLSGKIETVAEEGGNTVFVMENISGFSWTKEDLGVTTIIGEDGKITQEVKDAVKAKLIGNTRLVLHALTQDKPYEMYWYDKTNSNNHVECLFTLSRTSKKVTLVNATITYELSVAVNYADSGSIYDVDTVQVNRAHRAAENARAVVEEYSEYGDYDKLKAYEDKICSLTAYNYDALADGYPYGDPWQVVYVFDGDPNTKVVCEGYAKAFEYLCDMSGFASPMISCISVVGLMGGEQNMWNIVTLANGKNVLVDVTNSDAGSTSKDSGLFLAGYFTGSVLDGYYIELMTERSP